MLDARLRPLIDPVLERAGRALAERGVRANQVTVAGALIGIAACFAIALESYLLGLALILANRLLDGIDGAVARRTQATDLGGYIDMVVDFIFYSAVPFAFALADPSRALAAAFLILSFVGTGVTFLAFAAVAARRTMINDRYGPKSIYYLGGLTEGAETILVFTLMALWPRWFEPLAYAFGALCWITTASRIRRGAALLRDFPDRPHSTG